MIETVARTLLAGEHHLLVTHEHPDGDALGSTLALAHSLEQLGKRVTLFCIDEIPEAFRFLPRAEWFRRDCILGNFDVVTIIDCGDVKRTGIAERIKSFALGRRQLINIDHHQRNDLHKLATINYVDYEASSAAELVLPLVQQLGVKIDSAIATCLLTGLYNDTGGFKHSNTSPAVLRQASTLLSAGARLKLIRQHVSSHKSIQALRLWGIALSRIQYHETLQLVSSLIRHEDLLECDATQEDLAGCVNLLNSVPGARAAMLIVELPDGRIKASVRTEQDEVDVAQLAQLFGGGGIRKAAGFSFEGRCVETVDGWRIQTTIDRSTLPFPLPQSEFLTA